MLARLNIVLVRKVEANVEDRHTGCLEVDCTCSVLQTAALAVRTVAVDILARMVVGVMQKVLEEAVALQIDSAKSLWNCRKDVIDTVVEAMTSADRGMAQTTSDSG